MKCYICEVDLMDINAKNTNNHKEHIIPNAIGGHLKAQDILCKTCGDGFGGDIDKNFVQIFFPFTERIDLSRQRGKNENTIKGSAMIDGELKQISFKNMKVFPKQPYLQKIDENNKIVYIYAYSKKDAQNFFNIIKKDLNESGKDAALYTFKCIDDMSVYVDYDFKMDNKNFKLGLNKIATEFAIYNKVDKHQLIRSLDLAGKQIIETNNVYPYFPLGKFEKAIELVKPYIDDNFPAHHLILFTEKKRGSKTKLLICYIELFSTFQNYVVLNENYKGDDIYENYYQTVIKHEPNSLDVEYYDMKDLMIVCQENGIPINGTIEELKIKVTQKLTVGKPYSIEFSDSLKKLIDDFVFPLIFSLNKNKLVENVKELPYFENQQIKKVFQILTDLDEQDLIDIKMEILNLFLNDDIVNIESFRKYYLGAKNADISSRI